MEEILFELKEYIAGLNAGRWDYIFSCIKTYRNHRDVLFPDRSQITMTVPFMFNYTELLVKSCHQHGAHAIGGMAAFIPNRRDPDVTRLALEKVHEDKAREAGQGFDGTWVAHPDLVSVAKEEFDAVLGDRPNQKDKLRDDVALDSNALTDFTVDGAEITESGLRLNVSVGIRYLVAWLNGNGAAAINNLMEDAATSEISRAQLWQWVDRGARLADGRTVTRALYEQIRDEEVAKIDGQTPRLEEAIRLMDEMIDAREFPTFLTIPAYQILD
jgi:malate synthase